MKELNSLNNFASFWQNYGKLTFFGLSLLCLAAVLFFCRYNGLILFFGIIAAVIAWVRLKRCNLPIRNCFVRGGWTMLQTAAFILPAATLTFEADGFVFSVFGMTAGAVAGTIIYSCSSIVSYYLKLNDVKEKKGYYETTRLNGITGWGVTYTAILIVFGLTEKDDYNNHLFKSVEYTKVISWQKEIQKGNTVYIVDTEEGRFAISPISYPEIRNINPDTELKVLHDKIPCEGCLPVIKLEIKN